MIFELSLAHGVTLLNADNLVAFMFICKDALNAELLTTFAAVCLDGLNVCDVLIAELRDETVLID